jgi:hypothetical protein
MEKQIQILELQLTSEKEKHQLVVSELHKDLASKAHVLEELRVRETA